VHLLLARGDGTVLLGLRRDTGWGDMRWQVPAVHLDRGETLVNAAVRAARTEIRVSVAAHDVGHAVTIDHCEGHERDSRLQVFFITRRWDGVPANAEPHRCARLEWFPMAALPLRTIGYTRAAIESFVAGEPYATSWRTTSRRRPVERELGLRVIDGISGL
jgi:8-oxo-dGTP diphosphatase